MNTKFSTYGLVPRLLCLAALLSSCSPARQPAATPSTSTARRVARDIAALGALKSAAPTCQAEADCIFGSHCDHDAHRCSWECLAASDCGGHGLCSDDGRCVDQSSAEGLRLRARDRAAHSSDAIEVLSLLGASCSYTDECPDDAYCDGVTHSCKSDCSGDTACTSGSECVHGRCVSPATSLPRISVSSTVLQVIPQDSAQTPIDLKHAQSVIVYANSADSSVAGKTVALPVTLTASPEVLVNCSANSLSIPSGTYSGSCVLDQWTFTALSSGGARAQKTVWIRLTAAPSADPTVSLPNVSLNATGAALSAKTITVELPPGVRDALTVAEGEYDGFLTLEGTGVAGTAGQAAPLNDQTIGVHAVRTATGILIMDATKQISPSGTLFYPVTGGGGYNEAFVAPSANKYLSDMVVDTGTIGSLVFPDSTLSLTFDHGSMTGRTSYDYLRKVRFDLARRGDILHPCSASVACPSGLVCDGRVSACVPAAMVATSSAGNGNTLIHTRVHNWLAVASIVLKSVVGSQNLTSGGSNVAERVACYPGSGTLDAAPALGSQVLPVSGELKCADGSVTSAVPLYTYQDTVAVTASVDSADMYAACLTELLADAPATASADAVFGAGVYQQAPKCIHLGRFAATLSAAQKNDPRLFLGLIRQWVGLHTFLAQQGRTQWEEASVLATGQNAAASDIAAASPTVLYALLEQLERGWDLVLSQDVLPSLLAVPQQAQINPDFRVVDHSPSAASLSPSHEQGVGIPVALLEAMTEHLNVLQTLMDQQAGDAWEACQPGGSSKLLDAMQESIGTTLRYVMAVDDYVLTLRRSVGTSTTPTWLGRYNNARQAYLAARQRISHKANDMFACKNPLGVSDDSLPLYFADPHGANDRYFAASDFMIGLADPKITLTTGALDAARSAWLAARSDTFQDTANQAAFDQRTDDLLTSLAKPINDACGNGFNARPYLDGTITPAPDFNSCFRAAGRPDCVGSRDATCYSGTLGELALQVFAAGEDVKLATSSWQDAQTSYQQQFDYCRNLDAELKSDDDFSDSHNKVMTGLRSSKLVADEVAIAADAAGQCISTSESTFGAGCGPAIASGIAKGLSASFQSGMDQCEADYQAEMAKRGRARQSEECFHEADLRFTGIHTAQQTIDRRGTDAQLAALKFYNLLASLQQQMLEGVAAVAREKGRKLPSIAHHHWLNENADQFFYDLDLAKKLTYLSLQAVEYDHQQTFGLRAQIVKARNPFQLVQIMDQLKAYQNTRTVNGQRPGPSDAPAFVVLSVRDQILNMTSNLASGDSTFPVYDGYDINPRLRDRLRDPAAAIYDNKGKYLGQGITFTLAGPNVRAAAGKDVPLDSWNVPGADLHCAERLWGISATIGGTDVSTVPSGPLQVFKRNTFVDAWCAPAQQTTDFQVGRYQPTGYIFGIDPNAPPNNDETQAFLPALLNASFQSTRTEMEKSPPAGSEDLAGRGLYGDYVLVFPKALLNDPHFNIEGVEDVLLRFDFYRVSTGAL